jgi:hypothetical protein
MARVLVFRGRRKERSYDLERREMLIGRGEGADIRVDNPLVSRNHATISFEEGAWRVTDLRSPNGLYVNGERVERKALQVGDRIELGQHILIFVGAGQTTWDVDTVGDRRLSDMGGDEPTTILPPREIQSIQRRVEKRLKAHLVVVHDGQRTEIDLSSPRYVIGYSEDCEVRLPGRALFGKKVAEVVRKGDHWAVVALSSMAPVRVRGEKVSSCELIDGDVIAIKDVEITFRSAIAKE